MLRRVVRCSVRVIHKFSLTPVAPSSAQVLAEVRHEHERDQLLQLLQALPPLLFKAVLLLEVEGVI